MIHDHNSVAPRLCFSSSPPPFAFLFSVSFSSEPLSLFPYIAIYRKSHLVQGKLAQASCLLRAEVISSPSRARARLGEWPA